MKIKLFHCIHCDAETMNMTNLHMIFDQYHYTHDPMFGQTYYDRSETVDAGVVTVYVCNNCIDAMVNFGKRPKLYAILAAVVILTCISSLTSENAMALLFIPMVGAVYARFAIRGAFAERNNRRIDRTGVGSAGYSKDMQKSMANMFPDAETSFEQTWLSCNAAVIIVMLIGFILGFILKGTPLKILEWVILISGIIGFLINMRKCFSKEDGKGTYDEETIREAAKYYLYQDEGIRLKFQ